MDTVRLGIIGLGNMGAGHANYLMEGKIAGARLTAVTDMDPKKADWARERLGEGAAFFPTAEELFSSGLVDAVIVATPHYDHPACAIQAPNTPV